MGAVLALVVALLALAGCHPARRAHPPQRVAEAPPSGLSVCGSNGKTYPASFAVAAGVAPLYEGDCRRCEGSPCPEGEQCVLVPCPYREGAALDEQCLQSTGPKFCMPGR